MRWVGQNDVYLRGIFLGAVASCLLCIALSGARAAVSEKETVLSQGGVVAQADPRLNYAPFDSHGGSGYRFSIPQGDREIPVVVVGGTPYEMGFQYGRLMRREIQTFAPAVLEGFAAAMGVSHKTLQDVWAITSAYTDDRVEQEMLGLAAGAEIPVSIIHKLHSVPVLSPYSCSSIAAWGEATKDGHLYQTRDLDWELEAGAHEFPVVVVYVPNDGLAHVNPAFAGLVGSHTGMNEAGIALSEMGDSPAREMPYNLHAPHFTSFFRSFLYDMQSLDSLLTAFQATPATKRYHFVFGEGGSPRGAVKVRAHSVEPLAQRVKIWHANDPTDEFAPNVLECVVYNDEGRGAYPGLKAKHGELDADAMITAARKIATHGANVMDVVYDATAFRLWVSYAHGSKEAYQMPFSALDLAPIKSRSTGRLPDLRP